MRSKCPSICQGSISMARMVAVMICAFASTHAVADDTPAHEKTAEEPSSDKKLTHQLLVGADSDHDGIRDDVANLLSSQTNGTAAKNGTDSKVKSELTQALTNSAAPRNTASLTPGCLDYLLLGPGHQAAANRYVQSRTTGTFGSHPCDPVASPLIERPFETDYAQLPLGPVQLRYMKHE